MWKWPSTATVETGHFTLTSRASTRVHELYAEATGRRSGDFADPRRGQCRGAAATTRANTASCSCSRVMAVVKANAYGLGWYRSHGCFDDVTPSGWRGCLKRWRADGRETAGGVCGGCVRRRAAAEARRSSCRSSCIARSKWRCSNTRRRMPPHGVLKIDTGMNRRGFRPRAGDRGASAHRCAGCAGIHTSRADTLLHRRTNRRPHDARQMASFEALTASAAGSAACAIRRACLAALCSRGLGAAGIALYGVSPHRIAGTHSA